MCQEFYKTLSVIRWDGDLPANAALIKKYGGIYKVVTEGVKSSSTTINTSYSLFVLIGLSFILICPYDGFVPVTGSLKPETTGHCSIPTFSITR